MGQEMSLGHPRPYRRLCRCRRIRLGCNEKLVNPLHTHSLDSTSYSYHAYLKYSLELYTMPHLHFAAPTFNLHLATSAGNSHSFIATFLFRFLETIIICTLTTCILSRSYVLRTKRTSARIVFILTSFIYLNETFGIWNVLFGLIMRTSELIATRFFISCATPT